MNEQAILEGRGFQQNDVGQWVHVGLGYGAVSLCHFSHNRWQIYYPAVPADVVNYTEHMTLEEAMEAFDEWLRDDPDAQVNESGERAPVTLPEFSENETAELEARGFRKTDNGRLSSIGTVSIGDLPYDVHADLIQFTLTWCETKRDWFLRAWHGRKLLAGGKRRHKTLGSAFETFDSWMATEKPLDRRTLPERFSDRNSLGPYCFLLTRLAEKGFDRKSAYRPLPLSHIQFEALRQRGFYRVFDGPYQCVTKDCCWKLEYGKKTKAWRLTQAYDERRKDQYIRDRIEDVMAEFDRITAERTNGGQ